MLWAIVHQLLLLSSRFGGVMTSGIAQELQSAAHRRLAWCRVAKSEAETLRERLAAAEARAAQLHAQNAALRERLGEDAGASGPLATVPCVYAKCSQASQWQRCLPRPCQCACQLACLPACGTTAYQCIGQLACTVLQALP